MISIVGYPQKHSVIDEIDRFAKENNLRDPTTNLPVQQTDKALPFESLSDKISPKSSETPMPVMTDREFETYQEKVNSVSNYYENNVQSSSQENSNLSVSEKNNFSNESQTHYRYTEEEVKQYEDAGISLGSNPEAAKQIIKERENEKSTAIVISIVFILVFVLFFYYFVSNSDSSNSNTTQKINYNTSQSSTHNKINNGTCYLTKSDAIKPEMIEDDKLNNYHDLLQDEEIPDSFKNIIKRFLLPYRISILKYSLNNEYFNKSTHFLSLPPPDLIHKHSYIAPSLKQIKENPMNMAMGYPSWFYIAFPDVYLWASKGYGSTLITNKYKSFKEIEFVSDGIIRLEILDDIIKLYLSNTNKTLECIKY